jgi:hypothetical protein
MPAKSTAGNTPVARHVLAKALNSELRQSADRIHSENLAMTAWRGWSGG